MFLLIDALDEGHYWMNGSSAERRQHAPSILIYAAKCLQDGDYWSRRRQSFWKVGRPGFFPKSLKYVLRVTNRCSNHPSGVGMGHEFGAIFLMRLFQCSQSELIHLFFRTPEKQMMKQKKKKSRAEENKKDPLKRSRRYSFGIS